MKLRFVYNDCIKLDELSFKLFDESNKKNLNLRSGLKKTEKIEK